MDLGIRIASGMLVVLCGAAPASAQLFVFTTNLDASATHGPVAGAHDPVHDVYFVAEQIGTPSTSLGGRFVDSSGITISTVSLDSRQPGSVQVRYIPDLNDGVGGRGGFLVVWTGFDGQGLFGRTVSYAAGTVGPTTRLTDAFIAKFGVAYSPIDQRFLVGINRPDKDLIYRQTARVLLLDLNLQPIDDVSLSPPSAFRTCSPNQADASVFFCHGVDAVWNPVSGEFGVLYTSDQSQKVLARVSGDGTILSRTPLGIGAGEFFDALAVNRTTGNYLAVIPRGDQCAIACGIATDGAELSPDGSVLARGVVTSTLAHRWPPQLLYSEASGTFLLVGRAKPESTFPESPPGVLRLLELNQHGVSTGSTLSFAFESFVVTSHASDAEWLVRQVVGGTAAHVVRSGTRFGGTVAPLPSDCRTPYPFVSEGGICFNGGWLPPGVAPPPPAGPCSTPDPFAVLGGGRCINGGWVPPVGPIATPPPAPAPPVPGGCTTPDPFVVLGGGICANGGWRPPDAPVPTLPPTVPGGCTPPDPFIAMGGGRCVNGGWIPPGMNIGAVTAAPSTCTTPDPFVAMGGGVCVDGGWRPRR